MGNSERGIRADRRRAPVGHGSPCHTRRRRIGAGCGGSRAHGPDAATWLPRPAVQPRLPVRAAEGLFRARTRSAEHTSELQSLIRISYAVFCLKKKNTIRISRTKVQG